MELLSFVISFLIYLLVGAPLCLVLHEAGHATMILLLTRGRATFEFGARGGRREMRIGRLAVMVHADPHALFFCRYWLEDKGSLTRTREAWITLGGPLSSLLFTLVFGLVWWGNRGDPWSGLTIISLFNLLISAVPGNYPALFTGQPGIANDGRQLVELLVSPGPPGRA